MVRIRVRKFGRSLAVILPKEAIAHLNTGEGERLYFTEIEYGYHLTARDPEFESKMSKAGDIMDRYSNTLNTLAKSRGAIPR